MHGLQANKFEEALGWGPHVGRGEVGSAVVTWDPLLPPDKLPDRRNCKHCFQQTTYGGCNYNSFLPPANEVCEGYVFTGVCLFTGGLVWCVGGGSCMAGGHAWLGVEKMLGGMKFSGCACKGGYIFQGHTWQGGMYGRGHKWQGACMVGGVQGGGMHGREGCA